MPEFFRKKFLPFSISFILCALIYSLLAVLCLIPQNSVIAARNDYESAPYYSAEENKLNTDILVIISDTQFCFFLSLDSYGGKCGVTFFTVNCVKSSSTDFNTTNLKESAENFFGITAKRTVTLNLADFSDFIDLTGGITIKTPYGFSSPANADKHIALDEELHFFGNSVADMMSAEPRPDYDRLLYYANITALACSNALKNFGSDIFDFLINKSKTDISYVDYYNNKNCFPLCAESIKFSAPKGVWMNDKYYLQ